MLDNTLSLTVLFILAVSILIMILNRRTKDRCLKDFEGFLATMEDVNGKRLFGRLKVYNTGLEFLYRDNHFDKDGHIETSSILYKQEFNNIWAVLRFHDELSPKNQIRRQRQLQRSFHPRFYRRIARGIRNLMVNIKDSLTDITSTALSSISTSSATAKVITSQQKQVNKAQTELVGYTGTSYDPILERHIGKLVVLEITTPLNVIEEHVGIFKEYSSDFLEVMGLNYRDGERVRECDVIVPRSHSFIRHSNEQTKPEEEKANK